jgi:hypothetical protein
MLGANQIFEYLHKIQAIKPEKHKIPNTAVNRIIWSSRWVNIRR